jgi:hypothetical protein
MSIKPIHKRIHPINSNTDHTGTAVENNILKADANGLPADSAFSITNMKLHNFIATRAPNENDDSTGGYESGSHWWFASARKLFVCFDATTGSAIWKIVISNGLVSNKTGGQLNKLYVVQPDTPQGNIPTVKLAKANIEPDSKDVLGILLENIDDNGKGYVINDTNIYNCDGSGATFGESWAVDDDLWLSATNDGYLTNVEPASPYHGVRIGKVITNHATQGILSIRVANGWETYELHDISSTPPTTTGQVLTWNSGASIYIPQILVDEYVTVHGSSETLHDYLDDITPNGFLDITALTDAGGLNISWLVGNSAYVNGTILDMTTTGSPKTLTDNATNYMYSTVAGGTTFIFSTTPPTGEFAIRAIIYTEGGDILKIAEEPATRNLATANHDNLDELHSEIVVSGLNVSIDTDATNANDFTVAPGVFYIHAHERETNDTIFYSAGSGHAESLVERYYHSSGVWTSEDANGVDFSFWDNGTNKTAVSGTKWYCAFLYWESDGSSLVDYVYPQTEHSSEGDAIVEALAYPPYHQGVVVPLSRFVFRGDQSAFGAKAYFVDIRPLHGGGSGAGVNQNIFQTIASDSGSTTADSSTDTLTIAGGSGVDTSVLADMLTVKVRRGYAYKWASDNTILVAGDGVGQFSIPEEFNGMNLIGAHVHVYTASTSGTPTFQLHNLDYSGGASDMLTTKITIDVNEKDSSDATTPEVVDTTKDDVYTGNQIRIDCDIAGTGTKGGELRLSFQEP